MNYYIKKTLGLIVSAIVMFFFLVQSSAATETFRLGVATVKTGELASYGISALRGVQIAVEDINDGGGILGRQIEIVTGDDLCLPKNAITVASKLVEKDVHAVIGHICSGATFAALDTYKNSKIIVISPSATNPRLTKGGNYPNFYRTIASDNTQALVQVELAINRLKLRRIAIIHDKSVYGKGLAGYVKDILEKTDPHKIVLFEGVSSGSINFTQFVQKIKKFKADAVIYGGYHPGASKIVKQIRVKKMRTVFISGDGIKDESFIISSGRSAEGVYATAPRDTSEIRMSRDVMQAYRNEYAEEPGPFFLNAYAAVQVLANAFKEAGSMGYDEVSKALKSETVQTPIGNISFDEHGDAVGLGFSVFQVKNGAFVELK
ncbi:branched-chain amino acid ABC transporter substrate-binding protein [Desulfobacula sp.]|uniref:branched-chain amino acid ABC transporter substrate-binding protein n=1 Tax=Desulfobacula sp. TaxID=2593537 RepID=UPI00261B9B09|nr:branched-chain amino acid ABC transporter substrate-binding protein [Desulfobacula sp.]